MCVIIHLPKNKQLKHELLRNCYDNNPDGWGIMYKDKLDDKDVLMVARGLGDFNQFLTTWRETPQNQPRAIHFRIRTDGEISLDNCHPFVLGEGLAMMHNGIISAYRGDKQKSDTRLFAEKSLQPIIRAIPDAVNHQLFYDMVEEVAGASRLIFMDKLGKVTKTSVDAWHKEHGVYFSNSHSHKPRVVYSSGYSSNYERGYSKAYESDGWEEYLDRTAANGRNYTSESAAETEIDRVTERVEGAGGKTLTYVKDEQPPRSDLLPYGRPAVDEDEEDSVYEAYDLHPPTMAQLTDMQPQEMCDWVQDHPEDATDLIRYLIGLDSMYDLAARPSHGIAEKIKEGEQEKENLDTAAVN